MAGESEVGGMFMVACCRGRRTMLPSGVLTCRVCDSVGASTIPNARYARDLPAHIWSVDIKKNQGGAK